MKSHFTAPSHTLAKLAGNGHNPYPSFPCPRQLVRAFLVNPTSTNVDTSCGDEVTTVFGGTSALAMSYFGTTSFWDNP